MKNSIPLSAVALLISAGPALSEQGYGDPLEDYPGYPSMKERRMILLTNICRISPQEYRDRYLVPENSQASGILLEENYPSVPPLYWQIDLNRAARAHSEDMAQNHGLSHSSSDGTPYNDRITSYYTKSPSIGENITTGNSDAFSTMRQWLLDITSTGTPAPDSSAGDGHRRNIMSGNYEDIGIGYSYGPESYNHFWTMDLGGGETVYENPLTAGCHFITESDSTQFMATYTDPGRDQPQTAKINIAGEDHEMGIDMGSPENGTYSVSLKTASSCREYYFAFTDSEGNNWRYPEQGSLITSGEGSCTDEYTVEPSTVTSEKSSGAKGIEYTSSIEIISGRNRGIGFTLNPGHNTEGRYILRIITPKGEMVKERELRSGNSSDNLFRINFKRPVNPGVYILSIKNSKGFHSSKRITIF
ncbi:MAG: CAP domain-containing protein [Chitinivibrionales bacterium]